MRNFFRTLLSDVVDKMSAADGRYVWMACDCCDPLSTLFLGSKFIENGIRTLAVTAKGLCIIDCIRLIL